MLAVVVDHPVTALHRAHRRFEDRTTRITETLTRQQIGLLAYDAVDRRWHRPDWISLILMAPDLHVA